MRRSVVVKKIKSNKKDFTITGNNIKPKKFNTNNNSDLGNAEIRHLRFNTSIRLYTNAVFWKNRTRVREAFEIGNVYCKIFIFAKRNHMDVKNISTIIVRDRLYSDFDRKKYNVIAEISQASNDKDIVVTLS